MIKTNIDFIMKKLLPLFLVLLLVSCSSKETTLEKELNKVYSTGLVKNVTDAGTTYDFDYGDQAEKADADVEQMRTVFEKTMGAAPNAVYPNLYGENNAVTTIWGWEQEKIKAYIQTTKTTGGNVKVRYTVIPVKK